jgi:HAD superfamily hydrolase (TIGR01490 family)
MAQTDSNGRAAAFFDLDRTLMAGSSAMAWARASYEAGIISRTQMARWARDGLIFRLRGSTDETTRQAMDQIKEVLAGASARELERLGPRVLAQVLPRIYPQMLDEVYSHRDEGRPTFIVSAAGNDLVELVARVLGMQGGVGTRYEVGADGNFTGEIDGPFMYGEGKLEGMRRFASEHDVDLGESWAYSDSASDLPMLRAVGTPVVVNPDAELASVASTEGWPVMRFERLGRRLAVAVATLTAAAVGGGAATYARRRSGGGVASRPRIRR